jgi:predicted O-methyltransferase YrrM
MQKSRELATLIDFLRGREIRNVLEIGGFRGGTMWVWSQLATGHLVCVDFFVLEGRMERVSDVDYTLINANSHLAETRDRVVGVLGGESLGLLFIDGDHSYEGVRRDFELYEPLVRKGGVIAIHDTAMPHENTEAHNVIPLWEEVRQRYCHFQIYDPSVEGHWGGIGVLLP